jgi:hypothetical protein
MAGPGREGAGRQTQRTNQLDAHAQVKKERLKSDSFFKAQIHVQLTNNLTTLWLLAFMHSCMAVFSVTLRWYMQSCSDTLFNRSVFFLLQISFLSIRGNAITTNPPSFW